ncbi:MAG: DMT family transporter [Pseudomonadota bacterium]
MITAPTHPRAAALCMVGSMALLGFVDNFIATIAETISLWQFLSVRFVLAAPLVLLLAIAGLGSLRPKRLWAVALRSLLVGSGVMCYFAALAVMPIAQALAGLFTSPIFVLILSAAFLRRRIGPWRIAAVALGFAGTLIVLGVGQDWPGPVMLLPVAGGLLYACGSIATRELCAEESTLVMLLGILATQLIIGTVMLSVLAVADPASITFLTRPWTWPMTEALPYVALQAVISVAGVFLLIRAYQWGEASQVSALEYTIMIFGPAFAYLLFGVPITGVMLLGIALIMAAGVIIALRSRP